MKRTRRPSVSCPRPVRAEAAPTAVATVYDVVETKRSLSQNGQQISSIPQESGFEAIVAQLDEITNFADQTPEWPDS